MTVVSVSLSPELLDRLDQYVDKSGYSSRSEAVRLAVRDALSQFTLQTRLRGSVVSTVTVISEAENAEAHVGLMDLRDGFDANIFGNMHLHIEGGYCVEIYLVRGEATEVMSFISKAKAVKGVMEVNYTLTPLEGPSPQRVQVNHF